MDDLNDPSNQTVPNELSPSAPKEPQEPAGESVHLQQEDNKLLDVGDSVDMEQSMTGSKLFRPVGDLVGAETEPDTEGRPQLVDEIESMCMHCEQNGVTRLLLTKIPYFREVVLMSFYCSHCHFKNTEIQSAGEINKHGVKFLLKMDQSVDLERQIVKGDTAIFRIEELDLEIPPGRGRLSNVEGILQTVAGDLGKDQAQRKADHPELYEKISTVISSIAMIIARQRFPCTITLDDPAGNSWIEPSTQDGTSKYVRTEYPRSVQQNEALGLSGSIPTEVDASVEVQIGMEGLDILDGTTASHQVPCPGCGKDAFLNIQLVSIPYFKEVYITAVVCEQCGYRMNDVKTGGEIPDKGQRIWLDVHGPADLRRDILKSETCSLKIPECNVEVQPGTMGGRFTTVEGLLTQVRDDLRGSIFDMDDVNSTGGDSMPTQRKIAWTNFFADLEKAIRGDMRYTIIMEDPLGNSYVQSATAPMPDPQIRTESYHRTEEEEEDLGLLDMRTFQNADGDYVKDPGQDPAQNSEGIFDIEHPKS